MTDKKKIIIYIINIKINLFEFSYHCATLELVQYRCVVSVPKTILLKVQTTCARN